MTQVKIENIRVRDISDQQTRQRNAETSNDNHSNNHSSIDMNERWASLDALFQTTLRQLAQASDNEKFMKYTSALGFSNIESQLLYDAIRMKYLKKHQKFQQKQMNKKKPKAARSLTSSPHSMRPVYPQWGMPAPFILLNHPNAPKLPLPNKKGSEPPINVLQKQLALNKEKNKKQEQDSE